ncbi:hypothetical protein [Nonomuraea sp. C10]|uniref:hypothetical protein n=1 Tax=Nonomuraea sp. C10 TaxID=2600577 RepID=UPI0011CE5D61|nr:hypothetical protein [Nonomuraea sp. C10]TXK41822.1 hypothetical protein FR742_21660 [Nonomuraea sp. C10]
MTGPQRSRRRRRTRPPRSDWQFPLLTDWGVRPERQKLLVIVTSSIAVLAAAVALVVVVASLGSYTPESRTGAAIAQTSSALPQTFHGWASPKLFEPISDRAEDAEPLTAKEVFAQKTLTGEKKLRLRLVASKIEADCSAALWGEALIEQVSAAECSQAARGLYTSADGRYVGQYTLLNLRDGQAAAELVESLKTLYRGGWTLPLESAKAAFPGSGYTEAGGYALGHYVGLVWIGRADGAEPTAKDDYVSLALTLRGAEKPVYQRVVAITGPGS